MRDDRITARKMLTDWDIKIKNQVYITKWIPGDHYYVGRLKFDTYSEAKDYAEYRGYVCMGVKYTHIG